MTDCGTHLSPAGLPSGDNVEGFADGRVLVVDAGIVSAIGHNETGWIIH